MKFFAAIAGLVAATVASAQSNCALGVASIVAPDAVTVGVPFTFQYCSGTYFKTSSERVSLVIGRSNTSVAGGPLLLEERNVSQGYTWNVTLPTYWSYSPDSYFTIVEKYRGYTVPYQMDQVSKAVKVSSA